MVVKVRDFTPTGYFYDNAEVLSTEIERVLSLGLNEKIVLDFTDVSYFTTLFFNNTLAKYIIELGEDAYNEKFDVVNLHTLGYTAYMLSYDQAVESIESAV